MNPYITLAIAEQRNADMRCRAAAHRLAKAIRAGADRSDAQLFPAAECLPEVSRHRDDLTAGRPLAGSRR
jgi:hypothetical protein